MQRRIKNSTRVSKLQFKTKQSELLLISTFFFSFGVLLDARIIHLTNWSVQVFSLLVSESFCLFEEKENKRNTNRTKCSI